MSKPMNSLLVEDHSESADVLAMLLRAEGHAVKIASGVGGKPLLRASATIGVTQASSDGKNSIPIDSGFDR